MKRDALLRNIADRLGRERISEPLRRERADRDNLLTVPEGSADAAIRPVDKFKAELEALGGSLYLEESPERIGERLRTLIRNENIGAMVSWAREEFRDWPLDWLWVNAGCLPWPAQVEQQSQWREKALEADAGITTAEFAIAATGTLLLTTGPGKPRSASLLPKHHIALVRLSQLVPRLGDALASFAGEPELPSGCFLITGPSRTSDIENDLTIGVHGPARLTVLVT